MPRPHPALLVGAFSLLTVVWGTTWAVIRVGLRGVPPCTGVALRFAIAAAVLLLISPLLGVRFGTSARERRLWVVTTLFSFCISYGVVYWAEQWVPSGLASVLFATFPLFVALLAHGVLPGERLTLQGLVGILVGFGGVAVLFSEDLSLLGGEGVARAAAVMLLSPLAAAVANVSVKRWGEGIHPVSLTAVPMAMTAGVMGVVALLTERDRTFVFDATSVAAIVYLAVAGSAVTFTLLYWLLSHMKATHLSLMTYLIPVVALAIGAVALDERLTPRVLAGSALVVAGVAVAVRARPRTRTPEDQP